MPLSKEKLEILIARSTDIVIATDAKGKVDYYNDGATRSLGYSPEEIHGLFVGYLYPDLDEAKTVMQAMRDPSYGGRGIVETFQTTLLSKKRERIPVAISGTISYDENGEENGTVGFAKDLRDILRKDQLATLGEVAVGLSHEINNPLEVIVNQTDLLERDLLRLAGEADLSVESERVDAIRREVGRISQILEQLGRMVNEQTYETVEYIGPAKMIDLRRQEGRDHAADLVPGDKRKPHVPADAPDGLVVRGADAARDDSHQYGTCPAARGARHALEDQVVEVVQHRRQHQGQAELHDLGWLEADAEIEPALRTLADVSGDEHQDQQDQPSAVNPGRRAA